MYKFSVQAEQFGFILGAIACYVGTDAKYRFGARRAHPEKTCCASDIVLEQNLHS